MGNPNTIFVDNSVPFGSRKETIGTVVQGTPATISGGTIYILDNITLTYPTKEGRRPDQVGGPNGAWGVKDYPTGSATVQVPMGSGTYNSSTGGFDGVPWPTLGQGFVDQFLAASELWRITSLGIPFEQQGYYKVNVNLIGCQFPAAQS